MSVLLPSFLQLLKTIRLPSLAFYSSVTHTYNLTFPNHISLSFSLFSQPYLSLSASISVYKNISHSLRLPIIHYFFSLSPPFASLFSLSISLIHISPSPSPFKILTRAFCQPLPFSPFSMLSISLFFQPNPNIFHLLLRRNLSQIRARMRPKRLVYKFYRFRQCL